MKTRISAIVCLLCVLGTPLSTLAEDTEPPTISSGTLEPYLSFMAGVAVPRSEDATFTDGVLPPGGSTPGPLRTWIPHLWREKVLLLRIVAQFRDYGQGLVEGGWTHLPNPQNEGKKKKKRGESEDREKNMERAIRRAKSQVRRKVLVAGLDYLITLTFKENVDDFTVASRCLVEFVRLVHDKDPEWKYLAVPERQLRPPSVPDAACPIACAVSR